jgi:putative thioredoxin
MVDVTDATFETEVMARSAHVPVVVDLWATWCGPCRTLGPILERVIAGTDGRVVLAKVDVDANPQTSQRFAVQSIPAVHAVHRGEVVDGFMGAKTEPFVVDFVQRLIPSEAQLRAQALMATGGEAALREAYELTPDDQSVAVAFCDELVRAQKFDEALAILAKLPTTPEVRHLSAIARAGGASGEGEVVTELEALLSTVKGDESARQRFVDLLEVLGADNPRTAEYRRKLTQTLF